MLRTDIQEAADAFTNPAPEHWRSSRAKWGSGPLTHQDMATLHTLRSQARPIHMQGDADNNKVVGGSEGPTRTSRHASVFQKNPRVRKIRVRNSGAGNGCANFMDTWKKCVRSAGKTMSVKFPFFGVFFWGGGGGGSADFIFMGARIFLSF